jgi:hypothetical protein
VAKSKDAPGFVAKVDEWKSGLVIVENAYAIPQAFTVHALFADEQAPFTVSIDVVTDTRRGTAVRAWAERVVVATDREGGVSSTVLRAVPIREVMAEGCLSVLHQVEITRAGRAEFTPIRTEGKPNKEAIGVVRRLVGYVRDVVVTPPTARARAVTPAPNVKRGSSS